MKKSLAIMAPIAAILLSEGIVFRLLHWPGGGYILLVGGIMGVIAALLGMIYRLKQPGCKCTKWFVGLSLIVAIVTVVFKSLHFPGGGMLCLVTCGLLIPAVAIVLAIAFNKRKE